MEKLLTVALAAVLILAACGGGGEGPARELASAQDSVSGDSFCVLWTTMKTRMDDLEDIDQESLNAYLEVREAAAAQLPDELSEGWNSIVAWDDPMVEVIYAVDFDIEAVTEEIVSAAFGGVEAAETAEIAQETTVDQIDRWAVRNCEGGLGDALTFCDIWTDVIMTLNGLHPDRNVDPESAEARTRLADLMAQADAAAPAEIREHWDPIADYHLTRHDLLVTVNFDESLISDALLTDAFGSPEAAAAAAADAELSVAAVESWTATGCGDFCARSRELTSVIGELGEPLDMRAADAYGFAKLTRSLAHADVLMPEELLAYWEPVSAELADWMGWWDRHDYDTQQLNTPAAQAEAIEIYRQADYSSIVIPGDPATTAAIESWRQGESELTGEIEEIVAFYATAPLWQRPGFFEVAIEIEQWAASSCGDEVGGPGEVGIRFGEVTGAAGDQMVLVMGPAGSRVADLATPEQFLAGTPCAEIDRDPWGVHLEVHDEGEQELHYWERPLHSRSAEATPDDLCDWHGDMAFVEPGDYTVVAARYDGAIPRPDLDVEPTHCLALDVTVSGDTMIDLPELPECELAQAPPAPGEWGYTQTVSASTPGAGSLKIRIPSQVADVAGEGAGGGERYRLQALALPQGTTLNDVGREEVFPPAAGCVRLWPRQFFPDELEIRPVEFPLGDLPIDGLASCLDPDWLNGAEPIPGAPAGEPADDSRLPLAMLAPGVYDVYVRGSWEGWEHEGFCTEFEVTVDGDTVVDLPVDLGELEPCE